MLKIELHRWLLPDTSDMNIFISGALVFAFLDLDLFYAMLSLFTGITSLEGAKQTHEASGQSSDEEYNTHKIPAASCIFIH